MTPTPQPTQGNVLAAIVEAGQAIYLAEESTAKSIANGSEQQVNIGQNFLQDAEKQVTSAISSFESYETQIRASQQTSFWSSFFSWALIVVSIVASAFAGPEMLAMTMAMVVASKTGGLNDLQTVLGNAIGSKLLAGVILTVALVAVGAGAGGVAGAVEEDAGSVVEEAATSVTGDASSAATKESSSLLSKIKAAGRSVTNKIGSLSRTTAGGLNGLGQGLQNFNIGADIAKAMAKLNATWAEDLGIGLDVLVSLVAIVAEGAGTGNGMMRASAAGKGLCGSSVLINNSNLFKGVGVVGTGGGLGEGSCSTATGVISGRQGSAMQSYNQAQAQSSLFDSMKEMSHDGFTSWIDGNKAVEKALSKEATAIGTSLSAVNTELAIAMSGQG